MKLSHFAVGAFFLSGACGQFTEFSVDVEALQANKTTTALFVINNQNVFRSVTIQDITLDVENGVLETAKEGDQEILDNETITIDANDDVATLIDKGDLVIAADKENQTFNLTITNFQANLTCDCNGNAGDAEETPITIDFQGLNFDFQKDDLGFNDIKQNVESKLKLNPQTLIANIDFQQFVVAGQLVAGQEFLIDDANNAAILNDLEDNITNDGFFDFEYVLQAQDARVKP